MDLSRFIKGARSAEGMKKRLRWSGFSISGHRLWTDEEIFVLRLFFPEFRAIGRLLKDRSLEAIKGKAREIGLVYYHVHQWTAAEISKLRKHYPTGSREELCAMIPGVSWELICATARRYGFRRKKRPYVITGIVANDQLRAFCYEIGWIMRDLDEMSGTARYFQTRGHHRKYPNYRAIARAVKALGGTLEVHWAADNQS
jgi:hypothetical protein